MKRAKVILLLLLLPFFGSAQQSGRHITYITSDSLSEQEDVLSDNWRFHMGDSAGMASPDYNDDAWEITAPSLDISDRPQTPSQHFNGTGWLRLHFIIDSSLVNVPLVLCMTHYGASMIYVDGKKVDSFGVIDGAHSIYSDPQYIPFTIVLSRAGAHVIAVRYANYQAETNYRIYHRTFAGFRMWMGDANLFFWITRYQTVASMGIFSCLFSIFITLGLLHLLLHFYYRETKTNLYFSIFSFSLAGIFLIVMLNRFSLNVTSELCAVYGSHLLASAVCFAFSGFNNELFSKSKLRFRIITAMCIAVFVLWVFAASTGLLGYIVMVAVVAIEAIALTIAGMYRKVRGSRILGFGIVFFALFFFIIVMILLITKGNGIITDSTPLGRMVEYVAICAVLSIPISISAYLAWSFSVVNRHLKDQLLQVKLLSEKTLEQELEKKRLLENRSEELEREVAIRTEEVQNQKTRIEQQHDALKEEKRKSDALLLNILPAGVAEELKEKGASQARIFDDVTVMFTDFVDFTKAAETMTAQALVDELHACFKGFDEIMSGYGIEKIKTIGDAYLAVCGLPAEDKDHAVKTVGAALDIIRFMEQRKQQMGENTFGIRIGIHTGSVVAGIVGVKKFAYDIWGDTVNTAARMEQNSEAGKVNISQATYNLVKDHSTCTYRGEISAKNKGDLRMYFAERGDAGLN